MVNVILGRLELLAAQHTEALRIEKVRHRAIIEAENARHAGVISEEGARVYAQLYFEIDNLIYNMSQRCKARGIKEKEERYLWLHTLTFDQTFIDLSNAEQKDFRTHEYFDPMLVACDGNKRLLLDLYAKILDRYFPIGRADRTWRPELHKVDFKSSKKSDTRTKTYTIIHNWNHI